MEISALSKDAYHALLRRLQGSGYASDPASARDQELGAIARIAELAAEGLVRVSRNLALSSAVESLDALERMRFLVGSAGLSVERRQKRLVAFAQGAQKLVEDRLGHAMATYLGIDTGRTLLCTRDELEGHGASPLDMFVVGRREFAADRVTARDLDPILERGLPARALSGGVSAPDGDTTVLVYGNPLAPRPLAIGTFPPVPVAAQTKARCAPVAFPPGAVVTTEKWIETQAMLAYKSVGFSLDQAAQGRMHLVVAELGISATTTVDLGISWANRFIAAWGAVADDDEADLTTLPAANHMWLPPSKLGPVHALTALDGTAAGLTVEVDGADRLLITNTGAARFLHLLVWCSPPFTPGSSKDTQPWLDTGEIDHDQLSELFAAQVVTDGDPGEFGGVPAGAMRRVVYTGGLTREVVDGAIRHVILDASEDYRDRYLLVVPLTTAVATGTEPAYYPSANADGLTSRGLLAEAPRLFYTGAGVEAGSDAVRACQFPDRLSAPDIWLFVDPNGNLCAEMKAASAHKSACLMALIIATEKVDGSSVVTPVPVDITVVETIDLEQPQHVGVYAQGFQGGVPRRLKSDPAPRAIPTCPPLGLIAEGHSPLRPVSWRVKERLGAISDPTYEVRQPIIRQRRRLISITASAESVTPVDDFNVATELAPGVNDQLDFRDRLVWVEGRFSDDDIRVRGDNDSDAAGTPFLAVLYTGPYQDVEVPITSTLSVLFEFSRSGTEAGYHSRLCLRNTGTEDVHVNARIECSGFVGLTDLRRYGTLMAFTYSDTDEIMDDENRGYADDSGVLGGPYRG